MNRMLFTLSGLAGLAACAAAATPQDQKNQDRSSPAGDRAGMAQDRAEMAAAGEQGKMAEVNGVTLHYKVSGQGQPLILIHGFPLNGGLFDKQREELSKQFMVITPDLRGFGKSTIPDAEASIETYAKDIVALMDHLKIEKAIIGGHSMGGGVGLGMYKTNPERFDGLILIDTTAQPASTLEKHIWVGFARQAQDEGVASIAPPIVAEMLTGAARQNDPLLKAHVEGLVNAASVDGTIGGGEALANRPDATPDLANIKTPTLIIVGVEDTVTPLSMSEELNKGIAGSKLVIIEGASHAPMLEQPGKFNQAIIEWAAKMGTPLDNARTAGEQTPKGDRKDD